jgi:small acid-soluble spore protein B (major beta-type SASP)
MYRCTYIEISADMSANNTLVVPQANAALDQLKYEVAQELGIAIPQDGYYGNMTSRDTGSIGGSITRRLVQIAEQSLAGGQFK